MWDFTPCGIGYIGMALVRDKVSGITALVRGPLQELLPVKALRQSLC